jgi:hypothetical protein
MAAALAGHFHQFKSVECDIGSLSPIEPKGAAVLNREVKESSVGVLSQNRGRSFFAN